MPNKQINQFASGTLPLTGAELVPLSQNGFTVQVPLSALSTVSGGGGFAVLSGSNQLTASSLAQTSGSPSGTAGAGLFVITNMTQSAVLEPLIDATSVYGLAVVNPDANLNTAVLSAVFAGAQVAPGSTKNIVSLAANEGELDHRGAGTIHFATGCVGQVYIYSSGNITQGVGLFGLVDRTDGTGQFTNAYTIYAAAPGPGAVSNEVNGLRIDDMSNVAAPTSLNIRSRGANSKNVFEGNIAVGTSTFQSGALLTIGSKVSVTASGRVGIGISGTPQATFHLGQADDSAGNVVNTFLVGASKLPSSFAFGAGENWMFYNDQVADGFAQLDLAAKASGGICQVSIGCDVYDKNEAFWNMYFFVTGCDDINDPHGTAFWRLVGTDHFNKMVVNASGDFGIGADPSNGFFISRQLLAGATMIVTHDTRVGIGLGLSGYAGLASGVALSVNGNVLVSGLAGVRTSPLSGSSLVAAPPASGAIAVNVQPFLSGQVKPILNVAGATKTWSQILSPTNSPSALAAGQTDNYDPGAGSFQRWSPNVAGSTVTGMVAGQDGEIRIVAVNGAGGLTLVHNSLSSTIRFDLGVPAHFVESSFSKYSVTFNNQDSFLAVYSATDSRWFIAPWNGSTQARLDFANTWDADQTFNGNVNMGSGLAVAGVTELAGLVSTFSGQVAEPISGIRAVSVNQSGLIQIAMASVSGRMPAVGVVVDQYVSGQLGKVYTRGTAGYTSGLFNGLGHFGQPVWVGRSGHLVPMSGSFGSGGFASGDIGQKMGIVILGALGGSGDAYIDVNLTTFSGGPLGAGLGGVL